MGYGDPFGHPQLRQAIAAHLRANRGIACDAGQVFIVGGAQQAFHLIGATLLNPGERVWFENPGAIGARNSFIAFGAELVPVPVDR
jgi:GntR family transcriptional regulator/MocR family aminotransferase